MTDKKTVQFKLNHRCNMNGCVGADGETVNSVPLDTAKKLVERGGGTIIETASVNHESQEKRNKPEKNRRNKNDSASD